MEKRILTYRRYIDDILAGWNDNANAKTDAEEVEQLKKEHLTQISFFQHERLIHLIVTVTFALLEMIAVVLAVSFPGISTLLLALVIMILLIPYIRHYYILENEVQKMYAQYDKMCDMQKQIK